MFLLLLYNEIIYNLRDKFTSTIFLMTSIILFLMTLDKLILNEFLIKSYFLWLI